PEVDPPKLTAGVAAADREFASGDAVTNPDLDPRTDGTRVRSALANAQPDPVAHRACMGRVAGTNVSPDTHGRAVAHLDEIHHPIEVEVSEGRSTRPVERHDARCIGGLAERPILLAEEKVARVLLRVVGLIGNVSFGDEEAHPPVVVHVADSLVLR